MNDAGVVLLAAGSVFAGRYRIVRCVAAGGMAAVYEVFDARTERKRALKVLLPSLIKDPQIRTRFRREAKVTGSIESEHVVEIHDSGIDDETGAPFLVMELLRGDDLAGIVEKRGPLPPNEVVALLFQAALGIEKLHAAGIVHRDLKPENLFVTQRDDGSPRIKLIDFGIAKIVTQGPSNVTGGLGTPIFMAPEQIHGGAEISQKTDLYSLAHLAFALLVGQAYWAEESSSGPTIYPALFKLAMGPEEEATVRAARRGVELRPSFDAWFAKASAAAPSERFDSAVAQITALAESLGVPRPHAASGGLDPTRSPSGTHTLSGAWRRAMSKTPPVATRVRLVVGGVLLASIVLVALLATLGGTNAVAPAAETSVVKPAPPAPPPVTSEAPTEAASPAAAATSAPSAVSVSPSAQAPTQPKSAPRTRRPEKPPAPRPKQSAAPPRSIF